MQQECLKCIAKGWNYVNLKDDVYICIPPAEMTINFEDYFRNQTRCLTLQTSSDFSTWFYTAGILVGILVILSLGYIMRKKLNAWLPRRTRNADLFSQHLQLNTFPRNEGIVEPFFLDAGNRPYWPFNYDEDSLGWGSDFSSGPPLASDEGETNL